MRNRLSMLLMFMLIGCQKVTDKFVIEDDLPLPTTTIAALREHIVKGGGVMLHDEIIVVGCVTSDDSEDNFYGSLIVEDESGALELMVGTPNLSACYPEGLRVALRLNGCYADYAHGLLQVGSEAPEYEYYRVANLASPERVDSVVMRSLDVEPIEPFKIMISELQRSMCGRLIQVCGLRLVDSSSIDTLAGEGLDRAIWRGYSMFRDSRGDTIAVYTRDYARYMAHRIPQDSVNIVGVLQWDKYCQGEECYHLKMRYETDCTLY